MKNAHLILTLLLAGGVAACARPSQPLATVPFELVGTKLFLKAHLDGSPEISLEFDTGAGSSGINLRRLHLASRGIMKNEGSGTAADVPISFWHTISIGSLTVPIDTLVHLSLSEYHGVYRDAFIGYDLLKRYVIRIDYDTKTMSFYDPARFRYTGRGKVIPIWIWSNSALVGVDLTLLNGQRLHGTYMVDTGGELPLLLNTPLVKRHDLTHQVGKTLRGSISGSNGEEVPTYRGKTLQVEVGGMTFPGCPVRLAEASAGTLSLSEIDGILGSAILKMFNTTYDYEHQRMYWEPNRSFSTSLR